MRRLGEEPQEVRPLARLDPDHRRAVVGEVAHRDRPCRAAAELQDLQALEGTVGAHAIPSAARAASSEPSMPIPA